MSGRNRTNGAISVLHASQPIASLFSQRQLLVSLFFCAAALVTTRLIMELTEGEKRRWAYSQEPGCKSLCYRPRSSWKGNLSKRLFLVGSRFLHACVGNYARHNEDLLLRKWRALSAKPVMVSKHHRPTLDILTHPLRYTKSSLPCIEIRSSIWYFPSAAPIVAEMNVFVQQIKHPRD